MQEFFTLQLCTSGHKYGEDPAKKGTNKNIADSSGHNDEETKRRRQFDEEMKQVKRLRQSLTEQVRNNGSKASGKKGNANQQGTQYNSGAAPNKGGGKGGGFELFPDRQKWNAIRKRERLDMKLSGTNQAICMFDQSHSCKHSDGQCPYAHVCARCHKPGHACVDPECRATPRIK